MTILIVVVLLGFAALAALLVVLDRRRAGAPALLELLREERERSADERNQDKTNIAESVAVMSSKLDAVTETVHEYQSHSHRTFGALGEKLSQTHEGLTAVLQTNQKIHEVLANPKARGRLGERMADDILQLCEFRENVNYRKQRSVDGGRGVPDFTFFLPNDLLLHMDVKFPLDNY